MFRDAPEEETDDRTHNPLNESPDLSLANLRDVYQFADDVTPPPHKRRKLVNSSEVDIVLTKSGNYELRGSFYGDPAPKVIEKSILGKGSFGTVKIIIVNINGVAEEQAVKIINNPLVSFNIQPFFKYITDNNIRGLLVPYAILHCIPTSTTFHIMPLCEFGDGDKLIELLPQLNGSAQELIKRHVIFSLAKTFYMLDQCNIKHMDLKPSNILFDDQGTCFVCDFDFSVILDTKGQYTHKPSHVLADPKFSPTDHKITSKAGKRNYYLRSLDIYRLGLTYLLICCEIKKDTYQKLNLRQIDSTLLDNMFDDANLPYDIRRIITSLLQPHKKDRMSFDALWNMVNNWQLDNADVTEIFSEWCNKRIISDQQIIPAQNVIALHELALQTEGSLDCDLDTLMNALNEKEFSSSDEKLKALVNQNPVETVSEKSLEVEGSDKEPDQAKSEDDAPIPLLLRDTPRISRHPMAFYPAVSNNPDVKVIDSNPVNERDLKSREPRLSKSVVGRGGN